MDVHNLDSVFQPKRIAVIGAGENLTSVGSKVLQNLVEGGFPGSVYPVHPDCDAVLGIPCYRDVRCVPERPDLAVICTPAASVPCIVRECGEAGVRGLVILSAGFRETGNEGKALEEKILLEKSRFDGMRVVGPNCLGIIVPGLHVNASFATVLPKEGRVAFISQSGALCTSVLDWALEKGIGFSHFVSVGNMIDVDFGELIDYFGQHHGTDSILLYVESLKEARRFMSASRAFARRKPIVAYKAGRFAESAKAATSHTGAMAGDDDLYDAAFRRAGIVRVGELEEIFDCAELLARCKPPRGPRLGIVTNAGGPGVMATDSLISLGGSLADLTHATIETLGKRLPPSWSHGNPVDVLGDARPKRFARAVEIVLGDPGVDAVLVILTPQAMTDPTRVAAAVSRLSRTSSKPILAAWLGGKSVRDGFSLLSRKGIAVFQTPERAVRAFMTLVNYSRNLESLLEVPREVPVLFSVDREEAGERLAALIPESGDTLSEPDSKDLLAAYGIPVATTRTARSAEEAVATAETIGYPVVLKILSPCITHKTDVGGVELDLGNAQAVRDGYNRILAGVRAVESTVPIEGVTVQQMVRWPAAHELILGAKKDPVFGSVILAGTGGIAAEVVRDRTLEFPPLSESHARHMLESLRSWPLLRGYRGRQGVDQEKLVEVLMRFSSLISDCPGIREADVNPLLVSGANVMALDARIVIDRSAADRSPGRHDHLIVPPYPEEYVRPAVLKDGTVVMLRPIRSEDEPGWRKMLSECSRDTVYSRFNGCFPWDNHKTANRFCSIDYDREIAIVSEVRSNGGRTLMGVGRLVANPDLQVAEYAVLVADRWQNQGLGRLLTEACFDIARRWGVRKIYAETSSNNRRMNRIFNRFGFDLEVDETADTNFYSRETDRKEMAK